MTTAAPSEGQQLIKRTKSEEEILKKRPKRRVTEKKIDENGAGENETSDVASVKSNVASVTSNLASVASVDAADSNKKSETVTSDRQMKPPPLPPRQGVAPAKKVEGDAEKKIETSKKVENHVGSNGTPKSRIRADPRFVTEDKRSMSMTRLPATSNTPISFKWFS